MNPDPRMSVERSTGKLQPRLRRKTEHAEGYQEKSDSPSHTIGAFFSPHHPISIVSGLVRRVNVGADGRIHHG